MSSCEGVRDMREVCACMQVGMCVYAGFPHTIKQSSAVLLNMQWYGNCNGMHALIRGCHF